MIKRYPLGRGRNPTEDLIPTWKDRSYQTVVPKGRTKWSFQMVVPKDSWLGLYFRLLKIAYNFHFEISLTSMLPLYSGSTS